MFEALQDAPRLLVEADLAPVQGERFQPTGFADIGAATYQLADGTRMLLVESAQSVANRLEATIVGPDGELVEELKGLSYVRATLEGASDARTNTLIEAHRINSPFIISDKDFQKRFVEMAGYRKGAPIDWRKVARALFHFDVNSLLHGAFLANVEGGRLRIQRALTGFIEARDVREAVSGGVKNNPIDPSGTLRATSYDAKDVYSNVPYHRVEFTAGAVTAFFNLDVGLLRSYALPTEATTLLFALGLLKLRRFLRTGLRLRTACDLRVVGEPRVTAPEGYVIPSEGALLEAVRQSVGECAELFPAEPVTEIRTEVKSKKAKA